MCRGGGGRGGPAQWPPFALWRTIPVSIFHYICHVTAHFARIDASLPPPCPLLPTPSAMLTNQRGRHSVWQLFRFLRRETVSLLRPPLPPLFRSLPVIIRFCFHFCCLMLLILLTKALKVVHRTLRCANNKNATGNVAVKYTDATPPSVCPCLLRPRVLQKITKILFAALQLLAKKNHWESQRQRGRGRGSGRGRGREAVCDQMGVALRLLFHLFHFIHTPHRSERGAGRGRGREGESCLGAACTASVSVEKFHFPYDAWHFLPLPLAVPPPPPFCCCCCYDKVRN